MQLPDKVLLVRCQIGITPEMKDFQAAGASPSGGVPRRSGIHFAVDLVGDSLLPSGIAAEFHSRVRLCVHPVVFAEDSGGRPPVRRACTVLPSGFRRFSVLKAVVLLQPKSRASPSGRKSTSLVVLGVGPKPVSPKSVRNRVPLGEPKLPPQDPQAVR
jgi:hypothetical protein